MIPDSFIQDLLTRVDIVDVVGKYVQLRKGGANLLGLCPFHNEKSPSFTVSPTKQFYHCFGCGAHGSAIGFLMEYGGASFPDAVRQLSDSVGMRVPEEDVSPRVREERVRRQAEISRHSQVLETANTFYRQRLRTAGAAIDYLKGRGVSGQVAARYGLGWSGTRNEGLEQVFTPYDDPLLVEAGLVVEGDDGRRYDRFRDRITFPIRNARGHLIGFGGRVLGQGTPKYLNSPETPIFSKGTELYGLWEARVPIREAGQVVVVEGYMDVVALAQMDVGNAVATLGTATTPQHIQKLLRAADNIVFAFDGDNAGRRAAWRALQACLPLIRDDAFFRFLFLPDKHDPDSYVREFGTEGFRTALREAAPLSRFLLDELSARHPMEEAEGRAACVREAQPLLQAMPAGVLRLQIQRELAQAVRLTMEELAQLLVLQDEPSGPLVQSMRAPPPPGAAPSGAVPTASPGGGMEGHAPDDGPWHDTGSWTAEPPWQGGSGTGMGGAGHRGGQGQGRGRQGGSWKGGGKWQGRGDREPFVPFELMGGRQPVTPLAQRLLHLLLAHPSLAAEVDEDTQGLLAGAAGYEAVSQLITLVRESGAQHVGAIAQAAADTPLAALVRDMGVQSLTAAELPNPPAEWRDACRTLELRVLQARQSALIASGMADDDARKQYMELSVQIASLKKKMAEVGDASL